MDTSTPMDRRSLAAERGLVPHHGVRITDSLATVRARAALLVALVTIGVGVVGIVHPDGVTAARRLYFATPGRM